MSYDTDITIIGAGVVGLAIAAEVSGDDRQVLVLEKNSNFGLETSSRNSQVIHSGIYYPWKSLKAKACVEGRSLLYELCRKHNIPCKRVGKLIVAVDDGEAEQLQSLLFKGRGNGVDDLRMLTRHDIEHIEPNINAAAALLSPSTGIIDVCALMKYFVGKAKDNNANIVFQSKVTGINKKNGVYKVTVKENNSAFSFNTRLVINSAGLNSARVAELAGIDIVQAGYQLHFCKGEYFRVNHGKSKLVQRLIYPVPLTKGSGLGVHVTHNLDGAMLLGPNSRYVDCIDYSVDTTQKQAFYESATRFLPFIRHNDLEPEMAGIRPTLQAAGDGFKDFIITNESDKGLPGFINLIGIESPGLTSSPAIARFVGRIVDDALRNGG